MAAAHAVPLSQEDADCRRAAPFRQRRPFFSFNFGATPLNGFSKTRSQLDKKMRDRTGYVEPFVVHDIRRTVRTRLVDLRWVHGVKVPPQVAELVIAHTKPGMHKVYDLHSYDRREARRAETCGRPSCGGPWR